jgi:mannose-6-phosphate isomerase-like protein (cupin superfamily)
MIVEFHAQLDHDICKFVVSTGRQAYDVRKLAIEKEQNRMQTPKIMLKILVVSILAAGFPLLAQEPKPTCNHCPATYIPKSELGAYTKRAIENKLVDQQVRSVDIGKAQIGIGMVTRGKMNLGSTSGDAVAEHDQISEVYYIIEGSATFLTGPDLVGVKQRPSTLKTVREQNGPGFGASSIKDPVTHELKAGDVVIIPAGTGHWFTKIDDHITYVMVRIDPDKVVPLKSEAQSRAYLNKPYNPDQGNF